jgi:hypothetical protein
MTSYPREYLAAQVRAQEIEAETGITVRQQAEMPLDEWSRLAFGRTPAQAALSALYGTEKDPHGAAQTANPPHTGDSTSQTYDAPTAAQGRPFEELANEGGEDGFMAWRSQRQSQGEGIGLLNQPSAGAWQEASARHAGRSALIQSNVQGPAVPATNAQVVANMRSAEQDRIKSDRRTYYR